MPEEDGWLRLRGPSPRTPRWAESLSVTAIDPEAGRCLVLQLALLQGPLFPAGWHASVREAGPGAAAPRYAFAPANRTALARCGAGWELTGREFRVRVDEAAGVLEGEVLGVAVALRLAGGELVGRVPLGDRLRWQQTAYARCGGVVVAGRRWPAAVVSLTQCNAEPERVTAEGCLVVRVLTDGGEVLLNAVVHPGRRVLFAGGPPLCAASAPQELGGWGRSLEVELELRGDEPPFRLLLPEASPPTDLTAAMPWLVRSVLRKLGRQLRVATYVGRCSYAGNDACWAVCERHS